MLRYDSSNKFECAVVVYTHAKFETLLLYVKLFIRSNKHLGLDYFFWLCTCFLSVRSSAVSNINSYINCLNGLTFNIPNYNPGRDSRTEKNRYFFYIHTFNAQWILGIFVFEICRFIIISQSTFSKCGICPCHILYKESTIS